MTPEVRTEDLVAAAEAAQILGLARANSVATYASRYPDFPKPVVDLSASRVRLWLRPDIEAFGRTHRTPAFR